MFYLFSDTSNVKYNFYKDSNIAEVITCSEVLKKIEVRANAELALYPEHAGLLDVRNCLITGFGYRLQSTNVSFIRRF